MVRFNDTIDLVKRRTNGCLGPDGISVVYCRISDDREHCSLTFITKDDIASDKLTKLAVRYNHLFEDHLGSYTIKVLPATNYFKKDHDTYSIWNYSNGFDI